jgi:predicted phage terminase large subunit-like protein
MQNDPLHQDVAPFAELAIWRVEDPAWVFFGAVDPSLGKSGHGRDPSAVLIGGYNRQTGVLDVVEAVIARMLPDLLIETILALHQRYRPVVWAVEAIQFQEFLRTEIIRRGALRGLNVPARAVTPGTDKDLRIMALQPHIKDGRIRFGKEQRVLLDQLRHYPMADHDDGPDALQMLYATAVSASPVSSLRGTGVRRGLSRALADFTR